MKPEDTALINAEFQILNNDMQNRVIRIEHEVMQRYYADGAAVTWQRAFARIAELEAEVERLRR